FRPGDTRGLQLFERGRKLKARVRPDDARLRRPDDAGGLLGIDAAGLGQVLESRRGVADRHGMEGQVKTRGPAGAVPASGVRGDGQAVAGLGLELILYGGKAVAG